MQELHVVCAVIRKDTYYLAVQRSQTMREALLWEFPGGKVEVGETLLDAIHREVQEELHASVSVHGILRPSYQKQTDKIIVLHPILCRLTSPDFQLKEHAAFRWIEPKDFDQLPWCPADIAILRLLEQAAVVDTGWWR